MTYSLSGFLKGSAAYTMAKLSGALLSFAFTPFLLVRLGGERFGLWAILGSAVSYVSLFDMGLSQSFTRFLAEKRASAPAEASKMFAFGAAFYVVVGLVLTPTAFLVGRPVVVWMGVSPGLQATAYGALIAMVAYFSVTSLAGLVRSSLDAMQRVDLGQSLSWLGIVAYWAVAVLLVWLGHGVWGLVVAAFVGQLAVVAVGLALLRKSWPELLHWSGMSGLRDAMGLLVFGAGLQVGATATTVNLETDRVVIGKFVAVGAIASYELGSMLARMVRVLPQALLHSALPVVTDMEARQGSSRTRAMVQDVSRLYSAIGFFLAGGMAALAPLVLSFWIGSPQPVSARVLAVLAPGWAFVGATGVATTVLRARGRVKLEAWFMFCMALLNVLMTILVVKPFGVLGVVGATSAGAVLGSIVFIVIFCRSEGIPTLRHAADVLGRPTLATGLAVTAVLLTMRLQGVGGGVVGRWASLVHLIAMGVVYVAAWSISAYVVGLARASDVRSLALRFRQEL